MAAKRGDRARTIGGGFSRPEYDLHIFVSLAKVTAGSRI
jgi:hypothetical protein